MHLSSLLGAVLLVGAVLAGCANAGLSFSLPVGRIGGVGVSVDTSGRVGGSVGVGGAGGSVSVGGSGQLPPRSASPQASAPN
jgi:hypothetical protein